MVSNVDILAQALKELGGSATVRELNQFLWAPENRECFRRSGRAWSEHWVQHDLFTLKEKGRALGFNEGEHNRQRYYLVETFPVENLQQPEVVS